MPAKRRLAPLVMKVAGTIGNNLFAGQRPDLIAAVLAELMSTFLLNHRVPADLARQTALREEILADWCDVVRSLVALQDDPPASETMQ